MTETALARVESGGDIRQSQLSREQIELVKTTICRGATDTELQLFIQRFWARLRSNPNTGCWEWQGAKHNHGYGVLNVKRRVIYAHRVAYMVTFGDIPGGTELDHLCRNPACANPAHLEAVPHQVNVQRGGAGQPWDYCKRGHPLTPGNTYAVRRGKTCRTCAIARASARYHEKRQK